MKNICTMSASLIIAGALLTGCSVGPKYTRPAVPAPPAFRGPDDKPIDPETGSIGDQQWSIVFGEPELQTLIRTALQNNYDLNIAAQRVLEAQTTVRIVRSQQFPQITAGGTGAGADLPAPIGQSVGSPFVLGSLAINASWNPDFWGLYRKQTESAKESLLSQQWAQRAVRLSLVQQVATLYFELRFLDRKLEISQSTVKTREQSLALTRSLERRGAVPLSDVRQAEELLFTASAEVPRLEEAIQQNENAIRLLLGQTPGTVAHHDEAALAPPPEAVPTGLPSALLVRRPDIQDAEARLRAANAQVGVARAQFFPQLSLSGSAGFGGDQWSSLFNQSGKTLYGIGSVAQPIFQGGRLRGQYELSQRQKDELIAVYQRSILSALRDVSDALISVEKERRFREQQAYLVASAKDATRLARLRYQAGSTNYLEVLTTDSTLFSAQLDLATAQQNEALAYVRLYASLGGGWQ